MRLFFKGEALIVQRAAWPVGILGVKYPSLFYPYVEKSLQYMVHGKVHDAVIRNILRVLMHIDVPEESQSFLFDLCLKYIETPATPSAIKAFSIGVLQQICKQHPELANEIRLILEERLPFETPAFKARAKEFLKDMKKRMAKQFVKFD
jgi:hypothetical protein